MDLLALNKLRSVMDDGDGDGDSSVDVIKHFLIKDIATELAGDAASTLLL